MPFWDNAILNLIHGTTIDRAQSIMRNGPDLSLSRRSLDFGPGFYTTTRLPRAVQWALLAQRRYSRPAALIYWSVPYDMLQSWASIWFADAGRTADGYWRFVEGNRRLLAPHRSAPLDNFDVVVGPASISYHRRTAMVEMDQVSFHTDSAVRYLGAVQPGVGIVRMRVL